MNKKIKFLKLFIFSLVLLYLGNYPLFANKKVKKKIIPIYAVSGIAIGGYDPVAYFDQGKESKGKKKFSYTWKDVQWRFSSKKNLILFKKEPLKYSPQYGGHCAYGVAKNYLVKGNGKAWSIINNKLYLNYNLGIRKIWLKDPEGYINESTKNWPNLEKDKN